MNHNIISKVFVNYWKHKFDIVLDNLKNNFNVIVKYYTFDTSPYYRRTFIFYSTVYLFIYNNIKNSCSLCGSKYKTRKEYLGNHLYADLRMNCLDKFKTLPRYNWLYEGAITSNSKLPLNWNEEDFYNDLHFHFYIYSLDEDVNIRSRQDRPRTKDVFKL